MDTIGARVREIRNRYGMSQESFAESLNTYRIRINRIENNQIQPTFQEIVDICNNYNTDIQFFVVSNDLNTQDFKKISKRYVNNQQLSFEEKRETIETIYTMLAQNHLKSIYDENVTNNNKYIINSNICNKIDIESLNTK